MRQDEIKLKFCSDLNYPEAIGDLLIDVVQILKRAEIVSIIALGSLSKGELSYRIRNDNLILFSDVEFMVVSNTKMPVREKGILDKDLKALAAKFQPKNPLFDITAEFLSLDEFKRLPFKVRFYEIKKKGRVIFGQDIINLLPEFLAEKRDLKDTNTIILRRLLSNLLYFPKVIFKNEKFEFAEDVFKYIVARNSLDILTVILFRNGIFIPTYREKVKYIVENSGSFTSDFGPDFPRFLSRCLKLKLDMDFNEPMADLLENNIKYFKKLLVYILEYKKDVFGERDITTTKCKFLLKSPNFNLLIQRLNALLYPFLGSMIFFLINMNEAVLLFLRQDKKSLSVLDDAWWVLMRIGALSGEENLSIDFADRFSAIRDIFFLDFYINFVEPAEKEHVTKILNWTYES